MSPSVLCIRHLHKGYRAGIHGCFAQALVLRDVSLAVRAGETVAVVGAAGAGKTTLLLCAAGLLRPDAGVVERTGDARLLAPPSVRGVAEWRDRGYERTGERPSLLLVDCDDGRAWAEWPALARLVRGHASGGGAVLVAARSCDDVRGWVDRAVELRDGACGALPGIAAALTVFDGRPSLRATRRAASGP